MFKLLWVVQKQPVIATTRSQQHMNLNDLNLVNNLVDKEHFLICSEKRMY